MYSTGKCASGECRENGRGELPRNRRVAGVAVNPDPGGLGGNGSSEPQRSPEAPPDDPRLWEKGRSASLRWKGLLVSPARGGIGPLFSRGFIGTEGCVGAGGEASSCACFSSELEGEGQASSLSSSTLVNAVSIEDCTLLYICLRVAVVCIAVPAGVLLQGYSFVVGA